MRRDEQRSRRLAPQASITVPRNAPAGSYIVKNRVRPSDAAGNASRINVS
jgi:hypothetical protein